MAIKREHRLKENAKINFFETIKCDDYEIFHLQYHQKRMANTVGLNFNLSEYIYPPNNKFLKCKLTYNEEGIVDIAFSTYRKREIKAFKLIVNDTIEYAKKSTNREEIEECYAKKGQAQEIIIIKNGLITDTSIANIAIFDGTTWITPKIPLLKGTTRERLLRQSQIFEKDITVEMLKSAQKIALLNAMIDMDILEDYSLLT